MILSQKMTYICNKCVQKKYGKRNCDPSDPNNVFTMHMGKCDVCGAEDVELRSDRRLRGFNPSLDDILLYGAGNSDDL